MPPLSSGLFRPSSRWAVTDITRDDTILTEPRLDDGPGLVDSLWRFKRMVIALAIVGALAGLTFATLSPTTYRTTARVILKDPTQRFGGGGVGSSRFPERHLLKEAQRMRTSEVMVAASLALGDGTPASVLRDNVEILSAVEQDMISVEATARSPAAAARLADAIVRGYEEIMSERNATEAAMAIQELEVVKEQIAGRVEELASIVEQAPGDLSATTEQQAAVQRLVEIESETQRLQVGAALYGSGVELFEPAELPAAPVGLTATRSAAGGVALGLALATGLAWWRAGRVDGVESGEEPSETLRVPLLAKVPGPARWLGGVARPSRSRPFLIADHDVARRASEAYEFLATALSLALHEGDPAAVVITSAEKADGKTVTTVNTALSVAGDGRRVIVIDGDSARTNTSERRKRTLTALADLEGARGLADFVEGCPIEECIHTVDFGHHQISVMPRGARPRQRSGFYRLPALKKAIAELKERADLVLVDAPPALAVSDTAALASHVDAVVLVVKHRTKVSQLEALRSQLELSGTPFLGYVFNRAPEGRGRSLRRPAGWR